jgi:hypothetical protein
VDRARDGCEGFSSSGEELPRKSDALSMPDDALLNGYEPRRSGDDPNLRRCALLAET